MKTTLINAMDAKTEYLEIGQWIFFILSAVAAFLAGRIFATGRKAANAIECAAQIPELLEGLKVAMRVQQRIVTHQKCNMRLLILSIVRPADIDAQLHQIQATLAEEMEELWK